MFYAANIPIVRSEKQHRFLAGLRYAADAGRRPHILFGTKEYKVIEMEID